MPASKSCWACCQQRLKCDYQKPACRKCCVRGITCPGYEKKPLKWLQPGQTRSKGRRAKKETAALRLAVSSPSLSFSIEDELRNLYQAVVYHNKCMCPDLVANGSGIYTPFYLPPDAIQGMPSAVTESIMSAVLGHRIQMLNDASDSDRSILRARFQTHRNNAVHLISQKLASPKGALDAGALASVLSFLLAETQELFSSSWWLHCNGAYALIGELGGFAQCLFRYPYLRHLLRYLVLIDILGSTTSPIIEPCVALRQLEIVVLLPILFGNGLETAAPCPPELLSSIIMINHLRSLPINSSTERRTAAIEVLHRILLFEPSSWNANIHIELEDDNNTVKKASWDWARIAKIYQSASVLYCISTLFDPEDRNSGPLTNPITLTDIAINIDSARGLHRSLLLQTLGEIALHETQQLRKLTLWPLVMAALDLETADHASQGFILGELTWISQTLGTGSPRVAAQLLNTLWKAQMVDETCSPKRWDKIFDRPHIFAI